MESDFSWLLSDVLNSLPEKLTQNSDPLYAAELIVGAATVDGE